jgi:hypothetical protein
MKTLNISCWFRRKIRDTNGCLLTKKMPSAWCDTSHLTGNITTCMSDYKRGLVR